MSDEEDNYQILPTEEEVRREAVGKLVECSILKDRLIDLERDIANLRYLAELLDESAVTMDENGHVDVRPVYREIRARVMAMQCEQKVMEDRIHELKGEMDGMDALSNVKVVVKKL